MSKRTAIVERRTKETDIKLRFTIDGTGRSEVSTGLGFLDHMLVLFAKHGLFDLELEAKGDLHVDEHHTVEDVGLALGQALREALGDKAGLVRYGWCLLPMDDALARIALDCSGRPYLAYDAPEDAGPIGNFPFQLLEEFLRAFSVQGGLNLHVALLDGRDSHHMAEAVFKGLARALDQATTIDPRVVGVPSTKGRL
jgi:imidazoleglycerol-phosphate dehydratase